MKLKNKRKKNSRVSQKKRGNQNCCSLKITSFRVKNSKKKF